MSSSNSDFSKSETRLPNDIDTGSEESSSISGNSDDTETSQDLIQPNIPTISGNEISESQVSRSASRVVVVQPYGRSPCEDSSSNNDDPFSVVGDKQPFVNPKKQVSFLTAEKKVDEDISTPLDKLFLSPTPAVVDAQPKGNEGAVMQLMRRLAGRFTKPHYDTPPGLSTLDGKRFMYVRQLMDKDLNGRYTLYIIEQKCYYRVNAFPHLTEHSNKVGKSKLPLV